MKKNDYQIYVRRDDRKRLKEKFKVSDVTLSEALHFRKHSRLCREIRSFAVNYCSGIIFNSN